MKLVVGLTAGLLALASFATDYYVDANYGNDAWDGSTPEIPTQATIDAGGVIPGPRQTLQAGVDLAKKSGDIVHAAPGVYDKGGEIFADNVSNRVYVTAAGVGIVADKGNAVTFVKGRFSTVDPGNVCGPDAVRAIRIKGSGSYVKGFTICEGSTTAGGNYYGGGLYGGAAIDCVITNCATAYRGSAASSATLISCLVYPNAVGDYDTYDCSAYNCVFPGTSVYGNGTMLNCTFIGTGPIGKSGHQPMYNCYIEVPRKNSDLFRCYHVYATNTQNAARADDCRQITKAEANLDPLTYRPRKGSVLFDAGSDDYYDTKYAAAFKETFAQYDFAFTPRHRGASVDVGALEGDWAESFADILSSSSAFFTVTSVSDAAYTNDERSVALPAGTSMDCAWENPSGEARDAEVTFTAEISGAATLKVYLNGAATPTWTLAAADGSKTITFLSRTADTLRFVSEGEAGEVMLSAFATTAHKCYYVKPEGDDGADGLTLASAKRTLSGAMAIPDLKEVGIVYAAPGVYREGATDATGASNRVSVVAGVGLESIEGPEVTVIEGAADPGTEAEGVTNGCGFAAVRGAYVASRAWVRGFTVCNGHTRTGTTSTYSGGGVYLASDAALIDCIVTNNVAGFRGGGVAYGSSIRCTIGRNACNNGTGPGAVGGSLYGCYCHTVSMYDQDKVVNCTFSNTYSRSNIGVHLFNTLSNGSDNKCSHFHRCLFGGSLAELSDTDDLTEMNLGATTVNGMLDENQVPKYGSKPVDFGDVNHYVTNFPSAFTRFMWLDRRGAPRVSNGKIDCGAFEYDWRGDFAARMKRTARYQLVVESASADVTTNALGQVTLTDGTSLSAVWTVGQDDRMSFCVPVTGAGVVTVTVDGQAVTPESVTGFCQLDVAAGKHTIEIAFAGAGSATAHTFSLSQTGALLIVR